MELNELKAFVRVAEYGNFTKAAQSLYVTQPTLSRQIAALEQELGTSLFSRGKVVELTVVGKRCLPLAREIIRQSEEMKDIVAKDTNSIRGVLSIGYMEGLGRTVVADLAKKFNERYPDVLVQLCCDTPLKLCKRLENRDIDIAITVKGAVKSMSNVAFDFYDRNPLRIIFPCGHWLSERSAKDEIIKIAELKDEDFIFLDRDYSPNIVDYQIQLCMNSGFSPKIVYRSHDAETVGLLVAAGKGISFVSKFFNPQQGETADTGFVDFEEENGYCDLVIAYRENEENVIREAFSNMFRII